MSAAYRQKSNRADIRALSTKNLPATTQTVVVMSDTSKHATDYRPLKDIRAILFIFLPLIAALLILTYFDVTRHWVIPLANWLFRFGR